MMSPLSARARRLGIAAPLVGVLLLAACAPSASSPAAGSSTAACGQKDHYTIGVAQWDLREPYRKQAQVDFKRLVQQYPKFSLLERDAQGKVDQQVSDVDALLTQKADLIILYPGDSAGLSAEVKKVHDAGVPLLEIDRSTPDASQFVAQLGGDNKEIAKEQADYLAQNLPDGAKVAVITGDLSSDAATERRDGALEGLKAHPGIKVVAQQTANWRSNEAQAVVSAIIQNDPDLAGIIYANDEESLGGWQALKDAGKEGQVKSVGIDGLRGPANGIQEVVDNKLLATYVYPNGVAEALKAADGLLVSCVAVEPRQIIPTKRVDSSNSAAMLAEGDS